MGRVNLDQLEMIKEQGSSAEEEDEREILEIVVDGKVSADEEDEEEYDNEGMEVMEDIGEEQREVDEEMEDNIKEEEELEEEEEEEEEEVKEAEEEKPVQGKYRSFLLHFPLPNCSNSWNVIVILNCFLCFF